MSFSSHGRRLLTGFSLFFLTIAAIALRGWWEIGFVAVLSLLGLYEFYFMMFTGLKRKIYTVAGLILGFLIVAVSYDGQAGLITTLLLAALWTANLEFLLRSGGAFGFQGSTPYKDGLALTAGLLYIPVSLQFLFAMEAVEITLVILAVIASDVGAYYAGSVFGGRRIWRAISPGKTVAGSVGGLLFCIFICCMVGLVDRRLTAAGEPVIAWGTLVGLGFAINIVAQFGDFFESALKRNQGVKDSSRFLPGHGGVLDRIDGLLFAVPAYAGLNAIFDFVA